MLDIVRDNWLLFLIGQYPNGGYILAIGLAAVRATLPHPDPVAVSAHFLSPTEHGLVDVEVEPVRAGRAHSTAAARLLQGGTERARLLASRAARSSINIFAVCPSRLPTIKAGTNLVSASMAVQVQTLP